MTRHRTDLDTASANPITVLATICNRVTRICALSLGQSQKAASETLLSLPSCPRLPVKAKSPKSLILSNGLKVTGVQDPPLDAASWMPIQIYEPLSHSQQWQFIRTTLTRWGRSWGLYSKGRFGKRSLRVPTVTTGLSL